MIFALGFLAAALIALLIIPAINNRAERLARRRVEALFPLSISELTAEKDYLRAEFAVLQRRIERKAEEAQSVKHQSMEELGRRALRIQSLEDTLAERDHSIDKLESELKAANDKLASTDMDLQQTQTSLASSRETLSALEHAHRATLDELSNIRRELNQTQSDLTRTKLSLQHTEERLTDRDMAYNDLDERLAAALGSLDVKRITISDLETRLLTQTARGDDFEHALGERHSELSEERKRLAELAKNLAAEQERGLILEQRIRELETDQDEKAVEIAALSVRLNALADEKEAAITALDEALATTPAQSVQSDALLLQNEELRRSISDLADQIMAAPVKQISSGKARPAKTGRRKRAAQSNVS